jgi:hypothetical protein
MTNSKKPLPRPRTGPARFPGITGDAKALNVSRAHLYMVLTGQRTSAALSRRYAKLHRAAA